jgi:bifunctional DNA-binding transcriptional regulator/antitoxin component of YhaV-PrlF toxin-antitoxin module
MRKISRLEDDGRVLVPKEMQKAMQVKPGDYIMFSDSGGCAVSMTKCPYGAFSFGSTTPAFSPLAGEYAYAA